MEVVDEILGKETGIQPPIELKTLTYTFELDDKSLKYPETEGAPGTIRITYELR